MVDVDAADQHAELVLPGARQVDGGADDADGAEERGGREEHPLAAVIAEVTAVQRYESGELEHGLYPGIETPRGTRFYARARHAEQEFPCACAKRCAVNARSQGSVSPERLRACGAPAPRAW